MASGEESIITAKRIGMGFNYTPVVQTEHKKIESRCSSIVISQEEDHSPSQPISRQLTQELRVSQEPILSGVVEIQGKKDLADIMKNLSESNSEAVASLHSQQNVLSTHDALKILTPEWIRDKTTSEV
jgi:hypothetical protein